VSSYPAESYFEKVKSEPLLLRMFLQDFPKGGDLHTHMYGAIYAESYLAWAAEDRKCINISNLVISLPPCDETVGRPSVADIEFDPKILNKIIDAFSMRNHQSSNSSGHDHFFATFEHYLVAGMGREGSMLSKMTERAAGQNILYLEAMFSPNMHQARALAPSASVFGSGADATDQIDLKAIEALVTKTIALTDEIEERWHKELACASVSAKPGCGVHVRYLAQVIRSFPAPQVLAQTIFAFKLVEKDPRFVGLNFVGPEDEPATLRDYTTQMQIIKQAAQSSTEAVGISLHAGELAMPLVGPKHLRSHIHEAVYTAGAHRIGHGVDIAHETARDTLLEYMKSENILVEINLSSNAAVLGVKGDSHPFNVYRTAGVPLALSTDDEGVLRIDLTSEYVRAVQLYNLSYDYLKELSRNALAYSFLPGEGLFIDIPSGKRVSICADEESTGSLSKDCLMFIEKNEKAKLQLKLEKHLEEFESRFE